MKNRILTVLILMCITLNGYAQRNITPEEYQKIITTDTYYWGRSGFDLPLDTAKKQAREELINQISEFANSINANDLMQRANYVKFEAEGNKTRVIFYIPKDSLYIEQIVAVEPVSPMEVGVEPIVNSPAEVKPTNIPEIISLIVKPEPIITTPEPIIIDNNNGIIRTLSQITDFANFCTQLNKYKRQGLLFDSQSGHAPDAIESCIMAVFENNILSAIYDSGSSSRKDFLSGKTLQKPVEYYKNKEGIKIIYIRLSEK